jgi:protoheme IX farnesyltransferase
MEIYCWLLALVCIVPYALGQVGLPFLVAALPLNGRFILYSRSVRRGLQEPLARRMFGFSILYLFALFAALLVDALIAPFLLAF